MMDLVGRTLGSYRIDARLGSGGMGQVFRGVHLYLERPAAIKVMQAHLAASTDFQSRFLQEAKTAAALKHPGIVEIYEFGEQGGLLYLVMELMTDGSLRTLLQHSAGQPLPLALGIELICQAADGLATANALHVVHRDIKPDNLLLSRQQIPQQQGHQYQLKIGDFGLARLAQGGVLTTTGMPMGTLAYMSPEQCQGKPLDGRSDLYSLGVVLYEVVTGYQPFQINDISDAMNKHVNMPPPPLRQQRPDLPPKIEEIILRCLAKKPEERYSICAELASALQNAWGNIAPQTLTSLRPVPEQPTPTGTILQPPGVGGTLLPIVCTQATSTVVPRVRVLDKSGQTLQVAEVKSQGIIIGRQAGCDIVLTSQGISRQHLQIMWNGKEVIVKDLGSSNGTLLENMRLLPQVSQPWMGRQLICIGSLWLRLEGPGPVGTQTSQSVPGTQISTTMVRSRRVGMDVNPRTLTITPGQSANIRVTLLNLGSIVDWFTTTVEGVVPEWIQGIGQEVQLNPGMQETIELSINVARSPKNLAGEYPVTIRARSREQPSESGTIQSRWNVLSFNEDVLNLEPRRAGGRGVASYVVALQNSGNTPVHYELSGEDDEQKIDYLFATNLVDLPPGREARMPLSVRARRRWIGREERQPFRVHARPAGSSLPLSAPGEFVNKTLLPVWLLSAVGIALICSSLALRMLPRPQPVSAGKGQPTSISTTSIIGTGSTTTSVSTPKLGPGPSSTVVPPTVVPPAVVPPTVVPPAVVSPAVVSPAVVSPAVVSPAVVSPNPDPLVIPEQTVNPVAIGLGGAIGSQYIASQDRLYFVEYSGKLSVLDNASGSSPQYSVIGTGYTMPEDIYVTANGNIAYITERSGDLVRVSLSNPDRSQATVIASGLTNPHQIILDEARGLLYTVEFANPGRLLRIDLKNSNQMTPVLSNLQDAIGLLMSSDFRVAYITEQLSAGGQLVRFDVCPPSNNVCPGNDVVLVTSTTAPLFELAWANDKDTAILVTERDPANKVWYVDLKTPTPLQFVETVAFHPSSVVRIPNKNLLLVCSDSEIDQLS
jgi:eukaryotic-like serine/threonine-protein kinase